jgi:hypothetical protein
MEKQWFSYSTGVPRAWERRRTWHQLPSGSPHTVSVWGTYASCKATHTLILARRAAEGSSGATLVRSQHRLVLQVMENQCLSMRCSIMSKRSATVSPRIC